MQTILEMLEQADGFLSGEEMSEALGITRTAVWKRVQKLREQGYVIEAVTNLGYRLMASPDLLDAEKVLSNLGDSPWRNRITVLESVDSTNSLARTGALRGDPEGSVYLADEQTGGRGRQGRNFLSPKGSGIYLSILLRPKYSPSAISHVTAMAAVAACDAIEQICGVRPGIKWMNDLIFHEKKLAGILTELSAEWESDVVESLVIGIGINCSQQETDFPEDLRQKATSLRQMIEHPVDRNALAAALIESFRHLSEELFSGRTVWMERYVRDCITINRPVRILQGGRECFATATGVDENGALQVRYEDGRAGVLLAGDVSVRGMYGYI